MLEFYVISALKMSELYTMIAKKVFLPNFRGGPTCIRNMTNTTLRATSKNSTQQIQNFLAHVFVNVSPYPRLPGHVYSVNHKKSPFTFSDIFSKAVGNF